MCMRHGRALLLPILLPRFDNSTSSDSKTGFCGDCGGLTTIYATIYTTIYATIWSLFGLLRVEKLAVSNRESMRVVSVFLFHFFPRVFFVLCLLFFCCFFHDQIMGVPVARPLFLPANPSRSAGGVASNSGAPRQKSLTLGIFKPTIGPSMNRNRQI